MIDAHVNLHNERFDADRASVIARAQAAGVEGMLCICDRLESLPAIRRSITGQSLMSMWMSVGVHPHHAGEVSGEDLLACQLEQEAKGSGVVAIGETGLDSFKGFKDLKTQLTSLKTHIKAAQITGLPLIVHHRAEDAIMEDVLCSAYDARPFPILLHCYTGGKDLLGAILARQGYVSATGLVTFRNAHAVREVLGTVPPDRLLMETDAPYLAPVPLRGRRNEPANLPLVAQALASLKGMTCAQMAESTRENFFNLFKKARESGIKEQSAQ